MDYKTMGRRLFLIAAAALVAVGTHCGPADFDEPGTLMQGLTTHSVGPVGTSSGTMEGTGSDQLTPVTKITAYANSSFVYGLELFWGTSSKMYGSTNGLEGDELDFEGDPVKEIKYHVDAEGYLRGLRIKTVGSTVYVVGYLGGTQTVAFSHSTARFTDLVTYKGTISSVTTMWGATFHYTTP